MRNVVLAVLPEQRAVRVDHGSRVVVHARHLALVDRHDDGHLVLLREPLHQRDRRPRDRLGDVTPAGVLTGAEVRAVEHFLETQDLDASLAGFLDERQMLLEHGLGDLRDGRVGIVERVGHLNQAAANDPAGNFGLRCV